MILAKPNKKWYKKLISNKGKVTINGNTYINNATKSFSVNRPLYIFAGNMKGSLEQPTSYQLEYFKVYDNDTLVRDYVPCYRRTDNAAGLYDLVNNTFYPNVGTGNFTIGSEIIYKPILEYPLVREYVGDKLVYGTAPSNYEQLRPYYHGTAGTAGA